MRHLDIKEIFHECPVPTLIMEGRWDLTWNTDKPEKLQGCFSDSRLSIFEKAGHAPFSDEPEAFFSELNGFIKSSPSVSESRAEEWKKSVAALIADRETEATMVSDRVTFRMRESAPLDFDKWSFFWDPPNVPEGAMIGYEVRSGQGDVYFKWGPRPAGLGRPGVGSRSDFWKGQTDPSKLHGKDIIVMFWTSKGKMEFPPGMTLRFEFKKDGQIIKRSQAFRQED